MTSGLDRLIDEVVFLRIEVAQLRAEVAALRAQAADRDGEIAGLHIMLSADPQQAMH
jgi:hypothetical protein